MSIRFCWLTPLTSILADFLSRCSINYWERVSEIYNYNCGFVHIFIQFISFLFIYFVALLYGIYTFILFYFLVYTHLGLLCPLGHYQMFFFVAIFFALMSPLSNISKAIPISFWLMFAWLFFSLLLWTCLYYYTLSECHVDSR